MNAEPVPLFADAAAAAAVVVAAVVVVGSVVAEAPSVDSETSQFAVVAAAGIRSRGSRNKPAAAANSVAVPGCRTLKETAQQMAVWVAGVKQQAPFVGQSPPVDYLALVSAGMQAWSPLVAGSAMPTAHSTQLASVAGFGMSPKEVV